MPEFIKHRLKIWHLWGLMTLYKNWDAFQRAAELLYGKDPSKVML